MKTSNKALWALSIVFQLMTNLNLAASNGESCNSIGKSNFAGLADYVYGINDKNIATLSKVELLEGYFKSCIDPVIQQYNLKAGKVSELTNLFKAVHLVNFYQPRKERVEFLQKTYALLASSGIAYPKLAHDLYKGLIVARMFGEASKFSAKPKNAVLPQYSEPETIEEGTQSIMRLTADGHQLRREPFVIDDSAQVIIVSHPNCNFTRKAFTAIGREPLLSDIIADRSTLIMPAPSGLTINSVIDWNASDQYGKYPMNYVYREINWREIDEWGTPIFYFFDEGEIKAKLVGWPKEGHMEQLKINLKQIGLLDVNESE